MFLSVFRQSAAPALLFAAALAALAAFAAPAGAAAPGGAGVRDWLGYKGTESIGGLRFFDAPGLRQGVAGLIGADRLAQIEAMDAAGVVEEFDGALVAQFCVAERCAATNAALLFTEQGALQAACLFETPGDKSAVRSWRGDGWSVTVARGATHRSCFVTPPEIVSDYRSAVALAK